jgi:hypothetical protein
VQTLYVYVRFMEERRREMNDDDDCSVKVAAMARSFAED